MIVVELVAYYSGGVSGSGGVCGWYWGSVAGSGGVWLVVCVCGW